MDRAKGLLIKVRVGDEIYAVKKTNVYLDKALKQKAFSIAENVLIGKVTEVDDKYIEFYFTEDEDNQAYLYISPKTKTSSGFYRITTINDNSSNKSTNDNQDKNESTYSSNESSGSSNGWFGKVLEVIGLGVNAYTDYKTSSYDDYVKSKTDYPGYTYTEKVIDKNDNEEVINIPAQPSNNTAIVVVVVLVVLLILALIVKTSRKSNIAAPIVQNNRVPSVIYVR